MRRRLFCSLIIAFTIILLLPISASAFGGYVVVKGTNGYHSVLCENIVGYRVDEVKWYKTLKEVKRTGLNPADCCKNLGSDYEDDGASVWNSKDWKIDNAFEIERMWGILEGYDTGLTDGYDKGYDEGLAEGTDSGYRDGYNAANKKLELRISSLEFYLTGTILFSGVVIFIIGIIYVKKTEQDAEELQNQKEHFQELQKNETEKINAMRTDVLQYVYSEQEKIDALRKETLSRLYQEEQTVKESLQSQRDQLQNDISVFQRTIKETKQSNPYLASQISDAQYYLDMGIFNQLTSKQRPALRAADELKIIASEKRTLLKEHRQLQYQLDFYEKLFPWLEEFKEVPSDEAVSYATGSYGSEYDAVKKWISPEDFEKLSNAEKYQKILDRWKVRKKTDWDVGIEYERYIGYKLECDGYKVGYIGATLGLKDMGRDLIATKNGQTLIIQCKRWAKDKTIQLYGSTAVYSIEHPDVNCKAVFSTTATLSDTARKCAEYCKISVVEDCPMGDYPLIKCNANKDGEKIYHLPFDQQYDKIVISKNKQSFYAWTTFEAEEKGFRRAYRWRPNKS